MATSPQVLLFQLPFTIAERLALREEVRVPATFEEYLEFADKAEYKVEYSEGKIVSMGQTTDAHEEICMNIGGVFYQILTDNENFHLYGSNLRILVQETGAHYLPDASIILGEPKAVSHKIRKRTLKSFVNSFAIMEVFSEGTMDYDLTEKLPNYKLIPSLRYIIFIHQHKPFITIYSRKNSDDEWISNDCMGIDSSFIFEGQKVELSQLYRRVVFKEKNYDEEER